jgi:Glycoside-hydrolase family GH114
MRRRRGTAGWAGAVLVALTAGLITVLVPPATAGTATRTAAARTSTTGTSTAGISTAGMSTAGTSTAAGASLAAERAIPTPRRRGSLHITGPRRDGGTVAAGGLRWRPGPLPRGDRLLSFAVAYAWSTCDARGRQCRRAADSTATPFAARRYVVGHADAGRRLAVTETATEVVETDPVTFTFRVSRASARLLSRTRVGAFPAGRRPFTEFTDGTPERRTASAEEYFQVDPPHYDARGGAARQWYQVDGRGWRPMTASRLFYTGRLRPGGHLVAVRTVNRYGSRVVNFRWRVVPLPRPQACRAAAGRRCWYPQHLAADGRPMRWDWQIGRVTPLQRTGRRAVDLYDLDGFLTTQAQVHALRTTWQAATLPHPRAVCYLDLAWEDYRPDASPGGYFPAATLGRVYYGYPQERWVDLRQLDALKPMLDERLRMCARKGFDAVELDDIDSFDPPSTSGFHLTTGDAQNFLAYAFNEIHRLGMTGLWKNSPYLSWWGRRYADGAVVEECYRYHACFASSLAGSRQYGITCTPLTGRTPCGWDDFSADPTRQQPTGKWVGEAEYSADHYVCNPGQDCRPARRFATFCRTVYAPAHGFAAVKFDADLDGRVFLPCPRGE